MDVKQLTAILSRYPFTSACFSPYLSWLARQNDFDIKENDLVSILMYANEDQSRQKAQERLEYLESLLINARAILSLSDNEFRRSFFSKDLLTTDPEKVHDILAEPLIVVSLSEEHGFTNIRKQRENQNIPVADFVGVRTGKKYAIELKTIRMENNPKPQPGKPTGNAPISNWWGKMFRSNIITKIEDKNRKALKQLINTKKQMDCNYTMLAVYSRRLGPAALMETQDFEEELAGIKTQYEEIDYILFKAYFGQTVVVPPFDTSAV